MWDKTAIKNLLATNDKAVNRALLHLYERQTAYEQKVGETRDDNGVGFSAVDAPTLMKYARYMRSYNQKEQEKAKKGCTKEQYAEIANQKEQEKAKKGCVS